MRLKFFVLLLALLPCGSARSQQSDVFAVKRPAREALPAIPDSALARYRTAATDALLRSEHQILLLERLMSRDPEEGETNAATLVLGGLPRLDSDALERRARMRLALIEITDSRTCAEWSSGVASELQVVHLLLSADSTLMNGWLDITMEAMVAEIRQHPEPAAFDGEAVERLFTEIGATLSGPDEKRLWTVFDDLAWGLATDTATCWLDRTVYESILAMEPERRAEALRTMVAAEVADTEA